MPGDWISVSTTPTRLPASAYNAARLALRLDLPVPPRNEWTEMILVTLPLLRSAGRPACNAVCVCPKSIPPQPYSVNRFAQPDTAAVPALFPLPALYAVTSRFRPEKSTGLFPENRAAGRPLSANIPAKCDCAALRSNYCWIYIHFRDGDCEYFRLYAQMCGLG